MFIIQEIDYRHTSPRKAGRKETCKYLGADQLRAEAIYIGDITDILMLRLAWHNLLLPRKPSRRIGNLFINEETFRLITTTVTRAALYYLIRKFMEAR